MIFGNNHRGFTIIETMIAVFLLSVVIIGLASLATTNIKTNDFSETVTSATTLARDKIEELRGTAYARLANGSDASDIYVRNWTVVSSSPPSNYRTITVTVQWTWQWQRHSVELKTIRAAD